MVEDVKDVVLWYTSNPGFMVRSLITRQYVVGSGGTSCGGTTPALGLRGIFRGTRRVQLGGR